MDGIEGGSESGSVFCLDLDCAERLSNPQPSVRRRAGSAHPDSSGARRSSSSVHSGSLAHWRAMAFGLWRFGRLGLRGLARPGGFWRLDRLNQGEEKFVAADVAGERLIEDGLGEAIAVLADDADGGFTEALQGVADRWSGGRRRQFRYGAKESSSLAVTSTSRREKKKRNLHTLGSAWPSRRGGSNFHVSAARCATRAK